MYTVKGSFKDGVATPDEPVHGYEGQQVLITFLPDNSPIDEAALVDFPTPEEVVARIKALGPSKSFTPPGRRLSEIAPEILNETPIDPTQWDQQWAEIEAAMKQRDLEDDQTEGRT